MHHGQFDHPYGHDDMELIEDFKEHTSHPVEGGDVVGDTHDGHRYTCSSSSSSSSSGGGGGDRWRGRRSERGKKGGEVVGDTHDRRRKGRRSRRRSKEEEGEG